MSFPNAIHSVNAASLAKSTIPKLPPQRLRRPAPLPQRPLAPNRFRVPRGQKQIFLPNLVLALIRPSPHLPHNYASFMTPLWFNKLDMKDYLFNAYGLHVLHVRSYVIQSKVQLKHPRDRMPQRRWFRPASKKKMTVELATNGQPGQGNFVWPAEPEDLSPWGGPKGDVKEVVTEMKKGWDSRFKKDRERHRNFASLADLAGKMRENMAWRGEELARARMNPEQVLERDAEAMQSARRLDQLREDMGKLGVKLDVEGKTNDEIRAEILRGQAELKRQREEMYRTLESQGVTVEGMSHDEITAQTRMTPEERRVFVELRKNKARKGDADK